MHAKINLPASKSISNRLLVLQKLYKLPVEINNISDSDDTHILYRCLNSNEKNWEVGNCGTAMRFLTSYAVVQEGEYMISGDERMHQRPIGDLVNALKEWGAKITYIEKENYPPLKIVGKPSKAYAKDIYLDGSISSQYISSVMMVGCALPNGLNIHLTWQVSSKPYIQMTLNLMQQLGLDVLWDEDHDVIFCSPFAQAKSKKQNYIIESDWSAASYMYLWVLAAEHLQIEINDLYKNSIQGDSVVVDFFEKLGVTTNWISEHQVLISKTQNKVDDYLEFDCTNCPDLAPTVAVAAFVTKRKVTLTGLQNLIYKESNRLEALYTELNKFSAGAAVIKENHILYIHRTEAIDFNPVLETYHDHRMAMAFSVLAYYGDLKMSEPGVVSKSFPRFWEELESLKFVY